MYDFLIVGSGFAGSVLAERIASKLDKKILLVEKRNHTGGNAYDEFDRNGILVHRYGPHIFHTNSNKVFKYLSKFTAWRFYEHKVMASYKNELYPIPINRITLEKYFNKELRKDGYARKLLNSLSEKRHPILNSEDMIVSQMGTELFKVFFETYTYKQWHKYPKELNASVCGRIPIRVDEDNRYFSDKYQFMPAGGYNVLFNNMLNHPKIEVVLNTDYRAIINSVKFDKLIYTGPVDYFFDFWHGRLPYRSIRFEYESLRQEYFQPCPQVNYVDDSVPFTRLVEHKYLSGQKSGTTTISREYPQFDGEPFYPIPTDENRLAYKKYRAETGKLKNVIFCGRLAEYQYYNMDQVIANALKIFNKIANGK